ncbi:MAG: FAD-binding oxidoreductase [Actinobacteria bacterium]|nr:FAD-binding oxidoreductase [Actinomycetota bacterium]
MSQNNPSFKKATTVKHEILAGKFHFFTFKIDSPLTYLPGQYIMVKVAENRVNAYSIAGDKGNFFDILVDVSPGGPGSKYFENLKVNDVISFLGPFGIFTLKPPDGANQLLFLGTGSGCSPLKCMLEAAVKDEKYKMPISFYFGLRTDNDVFWLDYFNKMHQAYPNFNFKLSLSRPGQNWAGQTGHITQLIDKDFSDLKGAQVYLCGNHAMIEEATKILLSHGCEKDNIYTEKF